MGGQVARTQSTSKQGVYSYVAGGQTLYLIRYRYRSPSTGGDLRQGEQRGFTSLKAATQARAGLITKQAQGVNVQPSKQRFSEYVSDWLQSKHDVRESKSE